MTWNSFKERLDVFEAKIEESEKAGSCWESNTGHLACAASAFCFPQVSVNVERGPILGVYC